MTEQEKAELHALRMLWIRILLHYSDGSVTRKNLIQDNTWLGAGGFVDIAQEIGLLEAISRVECSTMVEFTETGSAALSAVGCSEDKWIYADGASEQGFTVHDLPSYLRR